MHIVFLNPYLPPPIGGIEKEIVALAREWSGSGHRVTIVATDSRFPRGSNSDQNVQVPDGIDVVRLRGYLRGTLRGFQPSRAPLFVPGLTDTLRSLSPDLLMIYNVGWPLSIAFSLSRLAVPSLYRTYYHPPGGRLRKLKKRLLLGCVAQADCAVAASQGEREQLLEGGFLKPAQIAVIAPGVERFAHDKAGLAAFRKRYALVGRRVILHVARLSRFKGTGHLVEVLPEVRKRLGEDVVLLLVGDTSQRDIIDELVERHRAKPYVRFTGVLPEDRMLNLAYRAADVFALPSAYESLGLVYVEALSEGVPVIACPGGGVREVIGDDGIILKEFGDFKGLSDALVELLANPELSRSLGESGRRRVLTKYLWKHTADRMLELAASLETR